MLPISKPLFCVFTLYLLLGNSWANGTIPPTLPGDTVVVEASTKSLKHKNRMRSNGRISFWDAPVKRFASTPFQGPAGYQIQKVSIPMECQCLEVDSFEVSLVYTDLESCASTLLYQKWMQLEGLKELQLIPMLSQKTHDHFVLSISLQPNRFPKDHMETMWGACFYLKAGLVASDFQYFLFESEGLFQTPAAYIHIKGKNYSLSPKMKLLLYQ
ncbi:MAG: hypothetical protein C0424_08000 [Sphingobacteriaceae bacterium]|nr:hypothetical protein [Sphingobacteriaceae bacterium]